MKGLLPARTRALIGGFIGLLAAAAFWCGWLDGLEDHLVDLRMRWRGPRAVCDEVRLVGIGDRDVGSALGRWPFPRAVHGDVISILKAAGARHITFDVLFTEASDDTAQDQKLIEAVKSSPALTLAYHFETAETDAKTQASDKRPHFITEASRHGLPVGETAITRGIGPVPPFAKLPCGYGAVNVVPDADGIIRRAPLFLAHGGRLYPSLAMQTVISALGLRDDQISIVPGREVVLADTPRGTLRIPIDEHGQYRINFLGDIGVFSPAFEYLDLYHAVESADMGATLGAAMKDRIALIGLASMGNTDVAASSIGRMPGIAMQATVVSNILAGDHLRFLPRWLAGLLVIAAGALLGAAMPAARPWLGLAVFAMLAAGWCMGACLLARQNWMPPAAPALLAFVTAALVLLGMEAAVMKKDRSRVLNVLGRYISRPLLGRLVNSDTAAPSATERRELTLFFSDIRGFTAWTERAEPDEVAARLNDYFTAMTPLIDKHGGTLDKFIGDCIMVFFGAPVPLPDHASRAARMAADMQQEMRRLNESWSRRGFEPLQIGIGIHTGWATVGSFGSASFLDYTAIGRAVNLAARIEAQAEGGKILVSARTRLLLQEEFRFREHPPLVLKGIPEPQVVWEVEVA